MGSSNIFNASLSGLNAAMYEMNITQNNIANASTPGYTKQVVALSPQASGSGVSGQGVSVMGVTRMYSQYLTSQVLQQQTQSSYQSSYLSSISQVNNLLSNTTSGVSSSLTGFFTSANSLANTPASVPARQTVLSAAQTVVDSFQQASQTLASISTGLTGQITTAVQQVNTYATQIAALNADISSATATSNGQQPNALLDQRDQLISQMSQQIGVSTQPQPDGTMSVFIGSGQALVVGNRAMALQTAQNPANPTQLDVAYMNNGKLTAIQQNSLKGGNLGAYIAFQNQELQTTQNQLGLVALGFANNINQQNQMGQDLNGAPGSSLINAAPPAVSAATSNTGTGSATATISNTSAMTASDYQLNFDGTNYTLVRLSDSTVTQLTAAQLAAGTVVDGVNITLSGAMAAGDSFTIQPTVNAASSIAMLTTDPAKIAAAAPILASAASANTGTGAITPGSVNTPLPLNANLQVPVTLTFTSPTTFTVAGAVPAVGPQTYTPGQNISYNGWTTQISGAPAAGDTFNVASNVGGSGDNRNALLMAGLQTRNLMANGTTSLVGEYSQLVALVGSKTNELTVTSQAQSALLAQTVAAQQAVSGVNLDEEAANLLQYQKAYQASAKAMQIANTMFDALLTLR